MATPTAKPVLSPHRQKLKMLEEKLGKLQRGEISAEYLEGEADLQIRQTETIQRTELFIRQLKEAIAQEEKPTPQKPR